MAAACTYISVPAVGGEHLVLLVEVEDLDERQAVLHVDRLARVVHRPSHQPHLLVVVEQVLQQALLLRQRHAICKHPTRVMVLSGRERQK